MNFIEELGGYINAKERCKRENVLTDADYEHCQKQLLAYRRQHDIFELEDLIVLMHTNYRSDVFALTKAFKEIYDEKGIVYRHATDEEIKAGIRYAK